MATVFEVQSQDITELNDLHLTRLLKMLLHLEAKSAGIAERAVEVALNIRVADGGEDGRIEWSNGPDNTSFLPLRLVQFQNKATNMGPTACANEIVASDGNLKGMVEQALDVGGAYILFTTQELNKQQKQERVDAIRGKLNELDKSYADTATIEIYDASIIQGWVNRYASAITAVLNWIGRPLVNGLCTWDEWELFDENHLFDYVADQSRNEAIESLRKILVQPRKCARIIGLSGLGKTRLAFEVCRGQDEDDGFSKRVVYIDAAYGEPNLAGLLNSWVRFGVDCLFVVDNCDLTLHKQLRREVEHPNSSISLLTLHFNPDKDPETDPVQLNTMNDDLIKAMLEPLYGERINDLDRIVGFAQGFPQMAVLLAKARLDQTRDMGSLTDDDLIKKMLWGGSGSDQQATSVLEACALFDKFGIEEDREVEARFIAEQIAGTDLDTLYRCIKTYEERGVVNKAGRLAQIIPKPLAIRLAADWWRATRTSRQRELIETEMPGQLERSFCDQVSKLDFLPEVKVLTQELCGDQGPFGQAEVILSARGSRLFRALVEVNPSATSDALYKVISNFTHEQLGVITGDVRRNLVWALEKLCFHEEVFDKSAKCLLWLASAENENWSNNATGQFLQLFRTFLSGTEATPESRLEIIDEALRDENISIRKLAVQALESVIDTHGGSRTVGAEYQGSGQPLEEWRPKVWQEAFDYWIAALERLVSIALENGDLSKSAKDSIGTNIRGLVQRSRDIAIVLDSAIKQIVEAQGALWFSALDSIKTSISFDSKNMPDELREMLDEWVELLTPENIEDRLSLIVSKPPYEHEEDENGHYKDIAALNAEILANEFKGDTSQLQPYLPQLLKGEQRQAAWFGRNVVLSSGEPEPLLSETIKLVENYDELNISFLIGLLDGVYRLDANLWENYINQFQVNKKLFVYYPDVIGTGLISKDHLSVVLKLIKSGDIDETKASVFTYGRALEHLAPDVVTGFVSALHSFSRIAAWVALDVLSMYCYSDKDKWNECKSTFKELLVELPLDMENRYRVLEVHHWKKAVDRLVHDNDPEFFKKLVNQILASCNDKMDYSDLHHYIKPALRIIFQKYGEEVWPLVAESINVADSLQEYRLTQLLGSEDSFSRSQPSVLSGLPDHVINQWCELEPEKAPEFIAMATEAYIKTEEGYTISPRAKFLLDEFGNNKKVLSALTSNMGTFGWSGSVVPIYRKEVEALKPYLKHKFSTVQEWAGARIGYLTKSIDRETIRDEESEWGIY